MHSPSFVVSDWAESFKKSHCTSRLFHSPQRGSPFPNHWPDSSVLFFRFEPAEFRNIKTAVTTAPICLTFAYGKGRAFLLLLLLLSFLCVLCPCNRNDYGQQADTQRKWSAWTPALFPRPRWRHITLTLSRSPLLVTLSALFNGLHSPRQSPVLNVGILSKPW